MPKFAECRRSELDVGNKFEKTTHEAIGRRGVIKDGFSASPRACWYSPWRGRHGNGTGDRAEPVETAPTEPGPIRVMKCGRAGEGSGIWKGGSTVPARGACHLLGTVRHFTAPPLAPFSSVTRKKTHGRLAADRRGNGPLKHGPVPAFL
ncbi:hypothetical protein SKAU_G00036830 [Synaphobranchus kaupii]|uniref:Uncharacterized protein n=1 Tax=Synaphobranchus kaupii TaxID=118154 RepID=A0A9Q1JG20_SYNKA|nr:hypothetical protein SKAU_G00036830 [Synaphobranchus kaupii]